MGNPLNGFLEKGEEDQQEILKRYLKKLYEDHLSAINYFLKEKNKRFITKIELIEELPKQDPPKHKDEVENKYRKLIEGSFIPFYTGNEPELAKRSPFLNP